ncbi:hypothetical protein AMECASPLE_028649 [Ameca splendens]|uniref:Secreted protein n=1 Tax=Ameca splendens TaxID=208324 RepID=A0ABV0XIL6_9TELE
MFLFLEATSGLALSLAVAPSWRGASVKLLLPTTYCSPSKDDTLGPGNQCLTLSLLDIATAGTSAATNCMCSLSYSGLKNSLRVHMLSCLSLLNEATKGATAIVLLFFPTESTPESLLLCSFCVSAPFSKTPSRSWQMAANTKPGSAAGFILLKGSFSFHMSLHACSV